MIQLPCRIGGMIFFRFVFVGEMVMKIFAYLLIINPSLYENIVNLFEHDMETNIIQIN